MDIVRLFPFRVLLSRSARADRRARLAPRLARAGLGEVRHLPAVEGVADSRGFSSPAKRSTALGKRLALRWAATAHAPALLLLEDDVTFAAHFRERITALRLPDDWQIFYFGAQHLERPERISRGLVRVRRAVDTHAVAFRAGCYRQVRAAMRRSRAGLASDELLAELHASLPTYAALPNLAWQVRSFSDLRQITYSNYDPETGRQLHLRPCVEGLD